MDSKRWQLIEELFLTVADRSATEREDYLTRVCGGDVELRREVLELLARDTAEDFLQKPIAGAAHSLTAEPTDDLTGARIGPYRLTRLLGRGGMGAVYEAVRDDAEFQQQVALKLIKRGMDSAFVRDRFMRERQILASLNHPHIARLFDGGTTADGQPYFVMEFVDGQPITEFCRRHSLTLDERLKLFRDVCAAVQHAHQKLVVHRDLKPSNILVTEAGALKLLDFGIAKLLTPDPGEALTRTETAMRLMTPDYASPEQVRGDLITTATDVYLLGVVLYELMAARRPHQFVTYSPQEIERVICDTEAPRPSDAARQQTGVPGKLARQLAGDLDNIVLMALRKEPERRYQSVEQFSEDIRRYLVGLPVVARKDTFGYRAGKFARRHKAGVAMLALLALLAVVMTLQAVRIARERDRANQEAATAQAVTQSLVAMFDVADPSRARGKVITARELLDQGAEKVVRDLKNQPSVQAKLLDTIGWLYHSIGLDDRAQPLLEEALNLRRQVLGAEHPEVAASLNHLGEVKSLRGDIAGSEALLRQGLAMRRKLLGKEHMDVAESLDSLGLLLVELGNFDEAEKLIREALTLRRKLLGEEHPNVAASLGRLGHLMRNTGRVKEAEALYRQVLALRRKQFGAQHPLVAADLDNLADTLQEQGDFNGAETLFREALLIQRKLLGEEHPDASASLLMLVSVLRDLKKYDEAEQLLGHEQAVLRQHFGEESPWLASTMHHLGTLSQDRGGYGKAEALYRQALARWRKQLGDKHLVVGAGWHDLAGLLYIEGKYAEAEQTERQAIDIFQQTLAPGHWYIQRSKANLGMCLVKLKRYPEAEEQLLAGYSGLKTVQGDGHIETQKAVSHLIELYEAWGKPAQANPYRALPHTNSDQQKK